MRFPDLVTPAERRLAVLLAALAVLGALAGGLSRLDPRVEAWLDTVPSAADSGRAGPRAGGGGERDSVSIQPLPREGLRRPERTGAGVDSGGGARRGDGPRGAGGDAGRKRTAADVPGDPNTADAAALMTLPGIGPALAARILEDRERNGPYRRAEDLLRVRGIGPATLSRIAPHLRLAPAGGAGG